MHPRNLRRDLLQVLGIDVLSPDNDQLFSSAPDVELAVRQVSQIPRQVPAIVVGLASEFRAVVVARKNAVALDRNLAPRALRQILVFFVEDSEPSTIDRPSRREHLHGRASVLGAIGAWPGEPLLEDRSTPSKDRSGIFFAMKL